MKRRTLNRDVMAGNLVNIYSKLSWVFLVFIFCFALQTQAQDSSNALNNLSKKDKKASLNFEDELVEGNVEKPKLFYLFQKKNFNYNRLIKLRENFLPEMRRTSEDVQRTREAD